MATFINEFKDKNILIPSLQRDYVQGGRSDVINPFLDKLIDVLNGNRTLELNYIYGYDEKWNDEKLKDKDCFVPIDGQQRLITLWLLHLYLCDDFSTDLFFASRESANEFSKALKENKNTLKGEENIKDFIINEANWFISGWKHDMTVANMLNTLQLISEKTKAKEPKNLSFENITFQFLNMKEKGLDDDIYIKMNGRGKPLSYFENLKSWMDEQVQKLTWSDNEKQDWKNKIDNRWTNLFWNNRNTNQEHPEEIDDEQLRFFYSMLLLYWMRHEKDFSVNENDKNALCEFLDISLSSDDTTICSKIIDILREGKILLPLYWVEKLQLFNAELFEFVKNGLDALCEVESLINNEKYHDYLDLKIQKGNSVKPLYSIAFETATYEKTLPYLAMLIYLPKSYRKSNVDFDKWVRVFKNLILNTTITKDNIANCIENIEKLSLNANGKDLYEVLPSVDFVGFNKEQVKEEKDKAEKILKNPEWEEKIIDAESYAFFKGAIRFLFRDEKGEVNDDSWLQFDTKFENAKKLIPIDKNQRHTIKELTPYLKIECIKELYYNHWVSNKDEHLLTLFLDNRGIEDFHHFFLQDEKKYESRVHSDIITLCEKAFDGVGYLRTDWDEAKYIWTNRETRHGYYWMDCFIIGDVLYSETSKTIQEKFEPLYKDIFIDSLYQGANIPFKFKDNYFTFCHDYYVYLMQDKSCNLKQKKDETKPDTYENNYCFRVTDNMSAADIIKAMDTIITDSEKQK